MRLVKLHQDLRERAGVAVFPRKTVSLGAAPCPSFLASPRGEGALESPVTLALPWEERREGRKAVLIKE